ncbi:MAG: PDZ domain-containing protein [Ruminococcaceae bacterium]|nr:PDZ domain-containing protein [Oscillospiraceae bacterium]
MNNDDFRPESENRYPYSSYYDSPNYTCQEPPRRNCRRFRGPFYVLLVILVIAAAVTFFNLRYDVQVLQNNNGWSMSVVPRGEQPAVPELPSPDRSKNNSAEEPSTLTATPTGDGTVLAISSPALFPMSLQDIYKKVEPSVVGVLCESHNRSSTGTGIIMSEDGYIITNCHVISGAQEITVELSNGEILGAIIVGADELSDLAVIKINATGLPAAEFGDSDLLMVGDEVSAIGNPLGLELKGTLTNGIISAINRDIETDGRTLTLIQTNAALNEGNSGGPLINSSGQVIGVNTMKLYSAFSNVEGLGFAIPISLAKPIIDELIDTGYVSGRPAIGITGSDVSDKASAYYRIPNGVLVNSVQFSSDAYAKGMEAGDVIVQINGVEITSMDELNGIKNNYHAGDTITLTVYRNGELMDFDIVLMDAALAD